VTMACEELKAEKNRLSRSIDFFKRIGDTRDVERLRAMRREVLRKWNHCKAEEIRRREGR